MLVPLTCPHCGQENLLFGKYCGQCGKAVTAFCRVCGEDNLVQAKFCRACGVVLASAVAGLFLGRALAWREQFRSMGWWDSLSESGRKLVQQLELPQNDRYEPWILVCSTDGNDWRPHNLRVSGQWYHKDSYLLATRCRLAALDAKNMRASAWWFTDLDYWEWKASGRVLLRAKQDQIDWMVKVKGASVFDVTVAMFGTGPGQGSAAAQVAQKTAQQRQFMEILGDFVREIAEVSA